MHRTRRQNITYIALLAASFLCAVLVSWTGFGRQLDNYAYDGMFRMYRPRPWQPEAALLAIDERTLEAFGGNRGIRDAVAAGLERIARVRPKAVAVDVLLVDDPADTESNQRLERAFARTPNLVLGCQLLDLNTWKDPLDRFRRSAAAVGHVHAEPDKLDNVTRAISLEEQTARDRRWALSLEAFRVSRGQNILESPDDVQVGTTVIPAPRTAGGRRLMRIQYMGATPRVSVQDLMDNPELASRFAGKSVFVGVTTLTAGDKQMTPLSNGSEMPGVEIHAQAFETIAQRQFLIKAHVWMEVGFALLLAIAAGLNFAYIPGWTANAAAGLILIAAYAAPYLFFTRGTVFSMMTPVSSAWLSIVMAAGYEHLVVRRALRRAEAERMRYQQSLHFVTHEMRTPLTAIQGSSELIGRYNMPDEKRKQIAQLINSESKRLARMIEMFLNVERVSAGQMELRRESFAVSDLMSACVERVRPLAERKQIRIHLDPAGDERLSGDRELMEYAFYNLLTNAVKYSPQQTQVTASARRHNGHVRISVQDQGIGMDQKEVRQIFRKFYRTKKAEQSGEAGTGIGLSIVEQIVTQHGGTIEVTSRPGEGSCFTLVIPAPVPARVEQKQ